MKKILMIYFFLLSNVLIFAQQKQITIDETVMARRQFFPDGMAGIKWKNNLQFTYLKNRTELMLMDAKTAKEISLLKVSDLNTALESAKLSKIESLFDYDWDANNILRFETSDNVVLYNTDSKKIEYSVKFSDNTDNHFYSKESKTLAYTIDNNLYIANSDKSIQITSDSDRGIVNGDANVHRHEFGIEKGIFWSPAGNAIAFYRKDETMVADYPLVDITTRIATLKNNKYPMAGETSEQVTLGVYNLKTGKTVFMKTTGPKDHYLTCISWDPTEKYVYIAELNREQNHLKMNKYDASTGDFIQTLFEEQNPKYVEPEHPLYFMKTKPDQFVWFSERDGFNHLYLYNTSGKLIKQLTAGNFIITDFLGFDTKEENFYVMSTQASPLECNLYKYSVKDGKNIKLTVDKGVHDVALSPDYKFFTDKYSNTSVAKKVNLADNTGKIVSELFAAKNPLAEYKTGVMNIGTITAADGKTPLYYRMIKPVDFDPSKKYPVIVYVYGGPHDQLVTESWLGGAGLWDYFMAQKGYIMFTVDNRGSENRGLEFENVIHRQCGKEEMKDQMKGIEFLKSLPYVDQSRIGVDGWSYGGFMTISLMLNYPGTFKVACAGGPVTDWKFYEVMYGERYMDTPQENPEGFESTSLLNKTKNLKGKLLVIHGGVDNTVVWQQSQAFLKSCIDNGVLLDYFVYPTHEHNVRGKDRVHLMRKITQYFDDYL